VEALVANRARLSYCEVRSSCGHDAFLLKDDFATYGEMIRAFLGQSGSRELDTTSHSASPVAEGGGQNSPEHGPTSIFHQRRLDYDRIIELIPPHASVLDLGCGSGGLLARLKRRGNPRVVGVELDEAKILACVGRGVEVIHGDLDKGLRGFGDATFDCVVLSQTLQAVRDVEGVIAEILRVGRTGIVSVPNLGYHKLREMLAREGRAPKSAGVLHYEWYNTPNIRYCSITDFEDFCQRTSVRIDRRIALDSEAGVEVTDDPNLNADLAIFVLGEVTASRDDRAGGENRLPEHAIPAKR
jgi:homoserine O-acetyltransferase/O-succinyltransferase